MWNQVTDGCEYTWRQTMVIKPSQEQQTQNNFQHNELATQDFKKDGGCTICDAVYAKIIESY